MSVSCNSKNNRESEIGQVQLRSFTNCRGLGPEKLDPGIIQECAKIVVELNQETAAYCTHAVYIGGTQDSEDLREELKRIRLRGLELAQLNRLKLVPLLSNATLGTDDAQELERLYKIFSACLELLEIQLIKTLALVQAFPLHNGTKVLINTGITEPFILCKHTKITVESLDGSTCSKTLMEQEEIRGLERDVNSLHELIYNINQSADINPWADFEPPPNNNAAKTLNTSSSISGSADTSATNNAVRTQRCVCVVVLTFSAIAISAVVIGVVLGII
ncbi:regulator of G-protein signaling 9-binding protein-like [Mizuhopecten yessoensis]|uniref:Regulator of G-protein signaling 9-binding protein n=1 Tax=Mizuhopecten yessoensis TaxID=6573 RepID=A0A210QFL3_MIZYE|nr:regulator of G-protein signaling 9-binding protein-like [Mizuhopecten yessoensis]XP_021359264.1 regulator of G-protein signaling 9-binding protein-like [Mizuhopecten yessoensis]OWF47536.1 Regulator of G-protein signaling 9-binding protein [Mizuhopecten yessoensis]